MSPAEVLLLAAVVMSQIRGVGVSTNGSRPVITVFSSGALAQVQVSRQGGEVTIALTGVRLGIPFTGGDRFEWRPRGEAAPIQALRIESGPADVTFRIAVAEEVPFEVHRNTARFTLVFGERRGRPGGATLVAQAPTPVPPTPLPQEGPRVAEEKRTPAVPEAAPAGLETVPAAPETAPPVPAPAEPAPTEAAPTLAATEPAVADGAAPSVAPVPAAEPERLTQAPAPTPLSPVPASETPGAAPPSESYVPPETQTLGDMEELRKKLFPGRVDTEVTETAAGAGRAEEADTVGLGPFRFRPSVTFAYVDAEAFFLDSPEVSRDRYLQIQPSLGAQFGLPSLRIGGLKISYTPRFRGFASFRELRQVTHELTATLDSQLTPALSFQANERFVRGIIETNEVDPGREYFVNLGRFTRNSFDARARLETGGRFTYELGGGLNHISFDEPSSFFGYDTRELRAGALYDLTPGARLGLTYRFDQVPSAPERPLVESHANSFELSLEGEVAPLTQGRAAVGYRRQSSPLAGEGGRSFSGLVLEALVTRELSRGAKLRLNAGRSTRLSAFEQNAFYVSTVVGSYLTLPLPADFSLGAGAGYQWNGYRTVAAELGEPRSDRIFSWSVGLGRPLTRWSFIRVDYRKDRRYSNIESLENDASAFLLQFGLGWFGTPTRP